MEPIPVTTQPLSSQNTEKLLDQPPELSAIPMFSSNNETDYNIKKENEVPNKNNGTLTEMTARFDSDTGHCEEKENEEEKKNRRQETQENVSDCCCVYVDTGDTFCMYYLCYWICDCFRGIGECTENCFEGCASCLSNCCEGTDGGNGDSGCLDCCCSSHDGDGCGYCCGESLTGCLDCCTTCSCDCIS